MLYRGLGPLPQRITNNDNLVSSARGASDSESECTPIECSFMELPAELSLAVISQTDLDIDGGHHAYEAMLQVGKPALDHDYAAVSDMLQLDPRARPTATELLDTPPFAAPPTPAAPASTPAAPESLAGLKPITEHALWMAALRVPGLPWTQAPTEGAAHVVRLCEVDALAPANSPGATAAALLADLVAGVPGNEAFASDYTVSKTVLCHCRSREYQLAAKVLDGVVAQRFFLVVYLRYSIHRGTADNLQCPFSAPRTG